jgi:hypothetical protein
LRVSLADKVLVSSALLAISFRPLGRFVEQLVCGHRSSRSAWRNGRVSFLILGVGAQHVSSFLHSSKQFIARPVAIAEFGVRKPTSKLSGFLDASSASPFHSLQSLTERGPVQIKGRQERDTLSLVLGDGLCSLCRPASVCLHVRQWNHRR